MRKFRKNSLARFVLLLGLSFFMAGCATQSFSPVADPPGFFLGLFHGFTILFSLIGSAFLDVDIYAYPNTGIWYDVGYFFGVSAFCGGGGAGAKHTRRRTDKS